MTRAPSLALLAGVALAAGCTPDPSVSLWGIVWDGPGDPTSDDEASGEADDPRGLAGAEVTFLDDAGLPLTSTTTAEDGAFEVVLPGGYAVFVEVRKEGFATTTFPGVIGLQPEQRVEDHTIYAVPLEDAESLKAAFTECPGATGDGALVYGQVKIDGLADAVTGGSPSVGTGVATVWGASVEDRADACYFDWSGTRYERKFDRTGPSGRFAVFDVQPGLRTIEVEYEVAPDVWMEQAYPLWIPDDPVVVSPWFPFLVAFPL